MGMNMHKQKYFILILPFITIGLFLLYILPADRRYYLFLVPAVFWLVYYSWIFIERKQKER